MDTGDLRVDCRHFTRVKGARSCQNQRVRLPDGALAGGICDICSFYEPPENGSSFAESLDNRAQAENKKWSWAVGMTTAPRRISTLSSTLRSVHNAGWDQVRVFAEPGVDLTTITNDSITSRDENLGAYPNFLLGLMELYLREPNADAYLMLQDDGAIAQGARAYLDEVLWPSLREQIGVVSLYCPAHHIASGVEKFQIYDQGWESWGALAYVFTPESVLAFLSDLRVNAHRRHGVGEGLRNVDSVVGDWCQRTGLEYFVHVPSLVQHTGNSSTLYPTAGNYGWRHAASVIRVVSGDGIELGGN